MTDLILDHVSKRYRVQHTAGDRGARGPRRRLGRRTRSDEFWALRDVSFEVARGETLGIIGDNGAGKSTILKLLSSVTAPTSGRITIVGKLSALIEVGSGFHPELTGRENVYLSGSILGMRRREIASKLERIVDFAGVRDFIDTPVKHYSSGMYLRLGFSIAAHLEPDILLLDEVLAVGDAAFQVKCLERINELHAQGRTLVFISHDLIAVERLCRRVLLMNRGEVVASGTAPEVIGMYQEMCRARTDSEEQHVPSSVRTGEVEITSVTSRDARDVETTVVKTGAPMRVRVDYRAHMPASNVVFELYMYTRIGEMYGPWCQLTTLTADGCGIELEAGTGAVEFEIPDLSLQPGVCSVSVRIAYPEQPPGLAIDWQQECLRLRMDEGRRAKGSFQMPHRWRAIRGTDVNGVTRSDRSDERSDETI